MSKKSNYIHRSLVRLAHIAQYKKYGPLIGPKEKQQPNPRWDCKTDATCPHRTEE